MELTKEQIEFLNDVCYGRENWTLNSNGEVDVDGNVYMCFRNLTEIPVRFGKVEGDFDCSNNQLTSLEFCPSEVGGDFYFDNNNLTNYFKSIKEEDFPHWNKLYWRDVLKEYPFMVNIVKKYIKDLKYCLNKFPQTKLYLE